MAGFAGFAPHEVVELLLTLAIPRKDVKLPAKTLLKRFGSLRGILDAPPAELGQVTSRLNRGRNLPSGRFDLCPVWSTIAPRPFAPGVVHHQAVLASSCSPRWMKNVAPTER